MVVVQHLKSPTNDALFIGLFLTGHGSSAATSTASARRCITCFPAGRRLPTRSLPSSTDSAHTLRRQKMPLAETTRGSGSFRFWKRLAAAMLSLIIGLCATTAPRTAFAAISLSPVNTTRALSCWQTPIRPPIPPDENFYRP